MKVFISFDMEGVAGIVDWSQCRPDGGAAYQRGCELLLGEVNAAVDGALAAGATEIVLNDAHGAMFNLDPARVRRPATYLSGRHKPDYMMQGLDASYDAIFFIGYHGSISGEPSTLSHTYNPDVITGARLNGEFVGESGINALAAHAHSVPIALITGDSVSAAEVRSVAPECGAVVTKQSVSRFAAHHLHPEQAREAIEAGAADALERVRRGAIPVPDIAMPATLAIDLSTGDMAEVATWVRGVERTATRSVAITGSDGLAMYRSFVALTYITRQAGGR